MNNVLKMKLLAEATGEVAARMESFVNLSAVKAQGLTYMELAAHSLKLPVDDARAAHAEGYSEFEQQIRGWINQKAELEISEAVREAEDVRGEYLSAYTELTSSFKTLQEGFRSQGVGKTFMDTAEAEQAKLMKTLKDARLLRLKQCFLVHLVGEETAQKLAELYAE